MKKRCYYEVLELSLTATLCQIRHSYHKLAMKWHPDKNRCEEAKNKFQEVSEAYSVLSNAGEKTWYDRHRETIIKNWNASAGTSATAEGGNTLTNGGSYWPYFVRPGFLGYDDSENGFYTVYRNVFGAIQEGVEEMNIIVTDLEGFEKIESETNIAIARAPSFGDSETQLFKVAQFYYYWEHLIPFAQTAWAHLYYLDVIKNPDISSEDRSWREKLINKFIEMIENIVHFVKTRDPRYHKYLENKTLIDLQGENDNNKEDKNILMNNFPESKEITSLLSHLTNPEKVCYECRNWATFNLKPLMQLDTKNTDWLEMLFGSWNKISRSNDGLSGGLKIPAIASADQLEKNQDSIQHKNKMIDEFPNNTYCEDSNDI